MTTTTGSANATLIPSIIPSLAYPLPRRGFLAGLAKLPLVGGSVALLGQPSAVAEPVSEALLWSYKSWLHYEQRMLSYELAGHDRDRSKDISRLFFMACPGADWHFQWARKGMRGLSGWDDAPQPSTRAALVLSAVGCDWHLNEADADLIPRLRRA